MRWCCWVLNLNCNEDKSDQNFTNIAYLDNLFLKEIPLGFYKDMLAPICKLKRITTIENVAEGKSPEHKLSKYGKHKCPREHFCLRANYSKNWFTPQPACVAITHHCIHFLFSKLCCWVITILSIGMFQYAPVYMYYQYHMLCK